MFAPAPSREGLRKGQEGREGSHSPLSYFLLLPPSLLLLCAAQPRPASPFPCVPVAAVDANRTTCRRGISPVIAPRAGLIKTPLARRLVGPCDIPSVLNIYTVRRQVHRPSMSISRLRVIWSVSEPMRLPVRDRQGPIGQPHLNTMQLGLALRVLGLPHPLDGAATDSRVEDGAASPCGRPR